jgi:LacI family transcriptional regulator
MIDIARDLNVSAVTVSKALRDSPDIGAETKKRVLQRAKELNFKPHLQARALATGRTSMIGLVVPGLTSSFFGEISQAIANTLNQENYSLVISSSEESPEQERKLVHNLMMSRMDALILGSVQWTVELFREIEQHGIPYVLIDRKFPGLTANFVGTDDEEIGYMATKHLLDVGKRRIAHIGGPPVSTTYSRLEGYKKALAEAQIVALRGYVEEQKTGDVLPEKSGYRSMKRLLKLNPMPDGVFCHNDSVAIGAIRAIQEEGLRVPQDIAVIGCGNISYADLLSPSLSSVDQGASQVGERAAKLALSLLDSKEEKAPRQILLKPKLVVRSSTKTN